MSEISNIFDLDIYRRYIHDIYHANIGIHMRRQPIKITSKVNDKPQLTALNVHFVITVYSILRLTL